MGAIKFLPYVGSQYECSRWGCRVMVLAESLEGQPEEGDVEFTREVMRHLFDGSVAFDYWMRMFIKFASALSGERESRDTCERVWDELLFYSYAQSLEPGPRAALTEEQLGDAKEAFMEVLRQWCPEVVLVWGTRLYGNLPTEGRKGTPCMGIETWVYEPAPGYSVRVLAVQHPASAFSTEKWHGVISTFMSQGSAENSADG